MKPKWKPAVFAIAWMWAFRPQVLCRSLGIAGELAFCSTQATASGKESPKGRGFMVLLAIINHRVPPTRVDREFPSGLVEPSDLLGSARLAARQRPKAIQVDRVRRPSSSGRR